MKYKCFFVMLLGLLFSANVYADVEFNKIPKKIHYVWFGGPEPESVKKNVDTWQKHMPNYEIRRWNEKSCNVNANYFVKTAYENKHWRFVSDWCRLEALYREGGIYLDTDMVLTASYEPLLTKSLILGQQGPWENISASIIAVTPNNSFISDLMNEYNSMQRDYKYIMKNENDYLASKIWTNVFSKWKEKNHDYKVYPANVFMLNFGGDENKSYHLFDYTRAKDKVFGSWYGVFQRRFMSSHALCIKNCVGYWAEYVLMPDNENFYIVHYQFEGPYEETYYRGEKIMGGKYKKTKKDGYVYLDLAYASGKEESYICKDSKCLLK